MNVKKILIKACLISSIFLLFLAGCGKATPTKIVQQNEHSPLDSINYNQYIKKTWVEKKGTFKVASFSISKIANGKITGRFDPEMPAVPNKYNYDFGHLTGTINKDIAECKFSDEAGNKGNIKLVFKPNHQMEATIKLTDKSKNIERRPLEGTFQYIPYNLNDIKEFSLIKDQSFMVDLNSWGNVKFVSSKIMGSIHEPPVDFCLTNKDGDILFEFDADLPYGLDVEAVSFKDVNKDGLKDIIIIVADNYEGSRYPIATFYVQKANGIFTNDPDLDREINDSGNNKDVKTVTNYLSKKF